MKFIVGLIVGAIVTLLVASLMTYRWEPPSRLAVVTASVSVPKPAVIERPVQEQIKSVTIAPLPAEPPPEPAPRLIQQAMPEAIPQALALSSSSAMPAAVAAIETAAVWKPFHSEVSATGFARRLSVQLGYPFRALKAGPARYHVVFDYDTEQQRALLLQQVTELTGFESS